MAFTKDKTRPAATSPYYTLNEAAALLKCSPSSIRLRLCGTERLTHVPRGNRIVVLKMEVHDLMKAEIAAAVEARPDQAVERANGRQTRTTATAYAERVMSSILTGL